MSPHPDSLTPEQHEEWKRQIDAMLAATPKPELSKAEAEAMIRGRHDALLLAAADALAAWLHREDRDKQGEPLIEHCRRVAETLREQGWPVEVQAAGLLHDALEQTEDNEGSVYGEFLDEAFGGEVGGLVAAVTRGYGETYDNYIAHIARVGGPGGIRFGAVAVKLADLRDNLDPARPIKESLRKRYLKAVERLEAVESQP